MKFEAQRSRPCERGASKTFVAVAEENPEAILGFYTVSPGSVAFERTPAVLRRGLARHDVPTFRLARLAVSTQWQGQGLGSELLYTAGKRCMRAAEEVGGLALVIDAKNDHAAAWYASLGAIALLDTPLTLMLSLEVIRKAVAGAQRA